MTWAASVSAAGTALIPMVPGDHLWAAFRNTTAAIDITILEGALNAVKVG